MKKDSEVPVILIYLISFPANLNFIIQLSTHTVRTLNMQCISELRVIRICVCLVIFVLRASTMHICLETGSRTKEQ